MLLIIYRCNDVQKTHFGTDLSSSYLDSLSPLKYCLVLSSLIFVILSFCGFNFQKINNASSKINI